MLALVSYASENMYISQERLVVSSLKYGVEKTFTYTKRDIDDLFYKMNQKTLDAERGAGYWLWKPYVINKALHSGYLHEGDILIYSDAGVEFINNPQAIIDKMSEDIFFFSNGWPHVEWCKADCYSVINGWSHRANGDGYFSESEIKQLDDAMFKHKQVQASVIFFKVTDKAKEFVKEWLLWCQMPSFIDDSPSRVPNFPTFAEHRHDQAILTCLQLREGYKTHWWPTIYSEHLPRTDSYPAMFNHHRLRNHEWK